MFELVIAVLIGILFLTLIKINFKLSLIITLFLSVLLHKELFSIYIWDLMPIRILMASYTVYAFYEFIKFNGLSLKFWHYLKDPFIALMSLFVVSKFTSLPFSADFKSSLMLAIFYMCVSIFLILIYVKLDFNSLWSLFKNYIYVGFILGLISLAQLYFYFTQSYLFGAILNIAGRNPIFPEFSWSYEYFSEILKLVVMTRVGSLFWDVNHFGGFIAALILPAFVIGLAAKKKFERFFFLAASLFLSLVLFLTNSRSAWLLFGVSVLIFSMILVYKRLGTKGIVFSLTALFSIAILLTFMYLDKESLFRTKVKSYLHYRLDSFDSHFLLLGGTVAVYEKFPWLGGGVGSFFEHFKGTPASDEFLKRDPAGLNVKVPAHTIWGEVIAETGTFGLLVFVLLYAYLLAYLMYSVIHTQNDDYILALAFFAGSIGWAIAGIFYSYNSEFYFLSLFLPLMYFIKKFQFSLDSILKYFSQKTLYTVGVLMLISIFIIFFNLGGSKFIPFDEAIYAAVGKNIYTHGDYLTLSWVYPSEWFEKPPLFFWLMSSFFHLFEVTEFSARLTSALAGLLVLLYTYKFSKLVHSSKAGYFSLVALATNITFLYYSRLAMIDVLLTAFILTASYYFIKFELDNKKKDLILSGLLVGFGVMTKSVIGFFPLVFFGIFYLIKLLVMPESRKELKAYILNLGVMLLLTLLISLPWHLMSYFQHGDKFINTYFGYHVFSRFATEIEDKSGPWDFYLTVIKISMRLYYIVLIPAIFYLSYLIFKQKYSLKYLFLIVASFITLIFFSSSSSKLLWYIIPIFPFLSIICGIFIADILSLIYKFSRSSILVFTLSYLIVFISFFYLFTIRDRVYAPDFTHRRVQMFLENNKRDFNPQEKLYVDYVEYPLAVYYSDRPFENVSFSQLRGKIKDNEANRIPTVFITKASRFQAISERVTPNIRVISINEDFVLGNLQLPK